MRRPTTVLYKPVGCGELEAIRKSGFRAFPAPPFGQPTFKPMLTREYAAEVARDWSAKEKTRSYSGYITQFHVDTEFLAHYSPCQVGGTVHKEYWIPADELDRFNGHIRGLIEVI